jgi:multiple sugar transport system ATP-binding protein
VTEHLCTQLVVTLDPGSRIRAGSRAEPWFDPQRLHVFDPETGENLTRDANRTFEGDSAGPRVVVSADGTDPRPSTTPSPN